MDFLSTWVTDHITGDDRTTKIIVMVFMLVVILGSWVYITTAATTEPIMISVGAEDEQRSPLEL